MAQAYFSVSRIKSAIEHLQNYDSNWVLVPLTLAVNGVSSKELVDINKNHGGDGFLNKYFSGDLIGLKAFDNNVNTLRPRFSDIYGNMKKSGLEDDYALHQSTRLWANVYSSRGYREMRASGVLLGAHSRFQLAPSFSSTWKKKIPETFLFEELLVWLYAFSGFDNSIDSWEKLYINFQELHLGKEGRFSPEYLERFKLNKVEWNLSDLQPEKLSNLDFQKELLPSRFVVKERSSVEQLNKVVYGPPGVGKSFAIKQEIQSADGFSTFITTFHPEYTYSDFVGGFRPSTEDYGKKTEKITYRFRPEVFINAYITAWKNQNENVFLVIEEINRGNSAAIFGDIFQLLDRDQDGYSEYAISCREEIKQYLEIAFSDTDYAEKIKSIYDVKFGKELVDPYSVLLLPPNLIIRATMNTSDQSLFPMDSAFKRRWTWLYMPIQYDFPDKKISLNEKFYSWNEFLKKINDFIYEILETEDKCVGSFFVNNELISGDEFRNKVIFYLWNDVLRDELPETKLRVFPRKMLDDTETDFPVNFNDFFHSKYGWIYIEKMLANLGLQPIN